MLYSTPLPYQADASTYFAAIRDLPWAAWLDSGGSGRYDILVARPVVTLSTRGERTEIRDGSEMRVAVGDPFGLLREQLGVPIKPEVDIPFAGGALGFWSYDFGRNYHPIGDVVHDESQIPDMAIGIYDWSILIDHHERCARLVSRQRYLETEKVLPQILARLSAIQLSTSEEKAFNVHGTITSSLTYMAYRKAYDAVMHYLRAGDCYQVNLAQRFSASASGDAYAAYLELRRLSSAPYSAFLDWPQAQILCASPEQFLRVQQGRVQTKPIKGTRARNIDEMEDARSAEELHQHPKDRAENLMIVDLLRNDISKNCELGSVCTPKLFEVESFANVHHLVSTVEGRLAQGRDALDVLRDCFPGGSITGAPKRRAMEIIDQLEMHRRGLYCGAIGYIGFDRNMDTNIAIRTLIYAQDEIHCWAGGGIVADSQCEAEYQETLDKAAAMLAVLRKFGGEIEPSGEISGRNILDP